MSKKYIGKETRKNKLEKNEKWRKDLESKIKLKKVEIWEIGKVYEKVRSLTSILDGKNCFTKIGKAASTPLMLNHLQWNLSYFFHKKTCWSYSWFMIIMISSQSYIYKAHIPNIHALNSDTHTLFLSNFQNQMGKMGHFEKKARDRFENEKRTEN